jgi:hypothetical protein
MPRRRLRQKVSVSGLVARRVGAPRSHCVSGHEVGNSNAKRGAAAGVKPVVARPSRGCSAGYNKDPINTSGSLGDERRRAKARRLCPLCGRQGTVDRVVDSHGQGEYPCLALRVRGVGCRSRWVEHRVGRASDNLPVRGVPGTLHRRSVPGLTKRRLRRRTNHSKVSFSWCLWRYCECVTDRVAHDTTGDHRQGVALMARTGSGRRCRHRRHSCVKSLPQLNDLQRVGERVEPVGRSRVSRPELSRGCNRCNAARQPWQIWRGWQSNSCLGI